MAEPSDTTEVGVGEQGREIPSLDGTTEPTAKSKKKPQPKQRMCVICESHPTKAASGMCAQCRKDSKAIGSIKWPFGFLDAQDEGNNTRKSSVPAAPEPVLNDVQTTHGTTGSSGTVGRSPSYASQPSPTPSRGRRNMYSPEESDDQNEAPESDLTTPQEVKSEGPELQTSASPLPVVNSEAAATPSVEVPISSSHKRPFGDVERDTTDNEGEASVGTTTASRKQRKLTYSTIPSDDRDAKEALAIDKFQAAVTAQEATQVQQLNDHQRAQEEQLEALRAAYRAQHDDLSAANTRFVDDFRELQSSRDYFEGEMEDWKAKHAALEIKLEATEDDRNNWKAAKEQVDLEKEGVEKDRDEWKSAKEKLDKEKATVEEAWAQSDEANAEEIAKLQKQVEKLRKGRKDLIKQLAASDSD